MSTATKLEYLNDTKQLLKENINNLGGSLTTEPFRQYASVLEGIYERIPKVSGIGSSLSLSPSMAGKIKLNEIQGDTLQDGTPTPDTPIEIQNVTGLQNVNVCGKNLFDMSTAVQSSYGYHNNTGTLTHIDNNTIKIVKGNTSTDARMSVANNIYLFSGTTISVSWEYGTGNGNVVGQIQAVNNSGSVVNLTSLNNSGLSSPQILTLTDDIKYIYLGTAWNNHSDLVIKNIQVEIGSATTYEPYKGNNYEVNLGKNLFDKSTIVSGDIRNAQTSIRLSSRQRIWLEAGTYTFSTNLVSPYNYAIAVQNVGVPPLSAYPTYIYDSGWKSDNTLTFTINQAGYVVISARKNDNSNLVPSDIENYNFQLEKGSQATSYSPYFTPIELNSIPKIEYEDSIKKSTGKNLFGGTLYNGITNQDGSYASSSSRITNANQTLSNTFFLKAGTYSLMIPGLDYCTVLTKDENGNRIDNFADSWKSLPFTFTTTQDGYLYFSARKSDNSNITASDYKAQVESGSSSSSYEPYGKVWYVEKQTGKAKISSFTGKSGSTANNQFTSVIVNDILPPATAGTVANILSNCFTPLAANVIYARDIIGIGVNTNKTITCGFGLSSSINTLELANQWLQNNNVEVVYPLATPTYTEITNTELIEDLETLYTAKSQEGTTNISITSEDLEMILNVSVLKGDVE